MKYRRLSLYLAFCKSSGASANYVEVQQQGSITEIQAGDKNVGDTIVLFGYRT